VPVPAATAPAVPPAVIDAGAAPATPEPRSHRKKDRHKPRSSKDTKVDAAKRPPPPPPDDDAPMEPK